MKTDLRIVKTHQSIHNALISLLNEKNYDDIVVQDILQRAMVNRSTFYKYYSGKDDLVAQMIEDYKTLYQTGIEARIEAQDLNRFWQETGKMLHEKRELVLALWKIETKRHHLYQDMLRIVKNLYLKHYAADSEWDDYHAELFATMVMASERYFFSRARQIPAQELVAQWKAMLAKVA